MKLIDKYLLRSFLVPLFYCLVTFLMLTIIHDLFEHLKYMLEAGTPVLHVLKYYGFLLPSVIIIIMPISLLLAVLYSLSSLTKNNELTAMRASGVSVYRLITPFIVFGLISTVLVGIIHEGISPWTSYWTHNYMQYLKRQDEVQVYVASNLPYRNEVYHRTWMIGKFDTRTLELNQVKVIQQREDGTDMSKFEAERAEYLDGRWWFIDGSRRAFDEEGEPKKLVDKDGFGTLIVPFQKMEMTDFLETPDDFINEIKDPEYLSSFELVKYLNTHRHLSRDTTAGYRVDLHHRLASPWTCLVVTMLGIPFGAQAGRKGAFIGVALSIGLFFCFYILINTGVYLGKTLIIHPVLAGWCPIIVFFSVGSVLIYRMR